MKEFNNEMTTANIDEENEFLFHFFHLLNMPNGRRKYGYDSHGESISHIFFFVQKEKKNMLVRVQMEMK